MNRFLRCFIILVLVQLTTEGATQDYYANMRHIGMEEGLLHYKVCALYPDTAGMWIGTEGGLNFFDGYNWQSWTADEGILTHNPVNFILKDQLGRLWLINTPRIDDKSEPISINILSANRDTAFTLQNLLGAELPFEISSVQHFFQDKQDRLFFLTPNRLWRFSVENGFEQVQVPEGFQAQNVFPDGTFAGKLNNKLTLVSRDGEIQYVSSYNLKDELLYYVIGTRQKFWVWHDRATLEVFENTPEGEYTRSLFPFQPKK